MNCETLSIENGGSRAMENNCNIDKILFFNQLQIIMLIIIFTVLIILIRRKQDD